MERLIKNNKLIADFIGASKTSNCKDNEMFIPGQTICRIDTIELGKGHILKFHKSWDWLMPVVEKIESEFCSSNIHYYSAGMMKQEYVVEFLGYNIDYDNSQYDKSKIKAVYKAVIKFIKWYNKNKANEPS